MMTCSSGKKRIQNVYIRFEKVDKTLFVMPKQHICYFPVTPFDLRPSFSQHFLKWLPDFAEIVQCGQKP